MKDLQQVERGIKRCLDFITGGDGDPGSVRDQLRQLETRKREIAADLKAQPRDTEISIHPNLPDLYRRKVARLQEVLADEPTRPQPVEIIRSLLDRIEVRPGKERGHCEVIIVGALAQILPLLNKKRPPPPRETAVRSRWLRGHATALICSCRSCLGLPSCVKRPLGTSAFVPKAAVPSHGEDAAHDPGSEKNGWRHGLFLS